MSDLTFNILLLILSYFVGSIPFTLIIGKLFQNTDIRTKGSGNLGGTNAIRVLGVKHGLPAGALDVTKAFLMVFLASQLDLTISPLYFGIAVALGHVYPIFAKLKGGKAVSTLLGSYLAIHPLQILLGTVFAFLTIKVTKYVSVASTLLALLLVIVHFISPVEGELIPRILFAALVIYKHKDNYKRLLNGTENKAKL